jgi:transcriptional regulator with XRE-family HTH domain
LLDFETLSGEWVRRVRGRRSQRGLSRLLGYKSNVVYRWETGRAHPSAATVFTMMQRLGWDVPGAVCRFLGDEASRLVLTEVASREGVAALLERLRGSVPIVTLAERSGFTRYQVTRWLQSTNEPRLAEFLAVVEASSRRVLDFVGAFFGESSLPSVEPLWRRLQAVRKAAYDRPESHLVLRALELESYRRLSHHEPGFVAKLVGATLDQEIESLELLAAGGQIELRDGKWHTTDEPLVDTRDDREASRRLRAFWLKRATAELEAGREGTFGYNLFSVSRRDLERLREIHLRYYREIQEVIQASKPNEHVALFATQLFTLDAERDD